MGCNLIFSILRGLLRLWSITYFVSSFRFRSSQSSESLCSAPIVKDEVPWSICFATAVPATSACLDTPYASQIVRIRRGYLSLNISLIQASGHESTSVCRMWKPYSCQRDALQDSGLSQRVMYCRRYPIIFSRCRCHFAATTGGRRKIDRSVYAFRSILPCPLVSGSKLG
jgi:hypothetical protein